MCELVQLDAILLSFASLQNRHFYLLIFRRTEASARGVQSTTSHCQCQCTIVHAVPPRNTSTNYQPIRAFDVEGVCWSNDNILPPSLEPTTTLQPSEDSVEELSNGNFTVNETIRTIAMVSLVNKMACVLLLSVAV